MSMENKKLFSVIVLVYNNSEYLTECIDSILSQSFQNIELIIADDCSKHFERQYFLDYIIEHMNSNIVSYEVYQNKYNLGTVRNINEALKKCKGDYIKIIAADDALFDSSVLSKAQMYLDESSDGIIVSDVVICDEMLCPNGKPGKFPQEIIDDFSSEECFIKLCQTNIIDTQGVFLTKGFFNRFGLFDEHYRLLEDWPKWLEVTSAGAKPKYGKFVAAKYRSDCGVGTGVNKQYLADKRLAFEQYIKPNWKKIGIIKYIIVCVDFEIRTSMIIRKVYSKLYRKNN